MKLREAEYKDWKLLLEWSNDKFTRLNAFSQSKISENEHKDWLKKYLLDEKKWMYILHDNNLKLGVIRVELNSLNQYVLSWSISPKFRGMGYGTKMLSKLLEKFNGTFVAEIKEDNIPSIKIAERNGFIKKDNITYIKINENNT